jgi:excisionase family DNA binding protein
MLTSVMIDQAAELLGVSRRTVYYRIREGRLHTIRTIGGSQRVLLDSLRALMREDRAGFRDRGAGVSDTGPSARSPVP